MADCDAASAGVKEDRLAIGARGCMVDYAFLGGGTEPLEMDCFKCNHMPRGSKLQPPKGA